MDILDHQKHLTIWKFQLDVRDVNRIEMPHGAKILDFQAQENIPTLWVVVNPSNGVQARFFRMVGTGHPIPSDTALKFIGTVQTPPFVWHLFEEV